MNYQDFISNIKEKITSLLEPDMTAELHTALKNNGQTYIGITITNHATNIFPTIYLEEYYVQYLNGRSTDDIADNIMSIYHEVKFEQDWDISQVDNFEHAKSKLVYKLIHFEKNRTLLNEVPFIPFHDLAIVFYLLLETTERGSATILVTNDLQHSWNICLSELYQIASQNTPKLLYADLIPMHAMILELQGVYDVNQENFDNYMYVLTNNCRHLGAACILYPHVLEDISNQLNEDFYVLPSSIHETIILPVSNSPSKEIVDEMIMEVNATLLSEEEILSEHAYYYSREKRTLLLHH